MLSPGFSERGLGLGLGRLLDVVGEGVLEVGAASGGLDVPVRGVAVWDSLDPGLEPGQVVLAVGVEPRSTDAAELVRSAGRGGAAAVVFGPGQQSEALRAAAAQAGAAVLFRTAWVDWARLVGVLRAGLASAGVSADPDYAHVGLGDLDGLAEAVAALVGGAVTIEDMASRVLAYSSTDEDVDELRRLTILGRRVPQWRVTAMQETGFFRTLWGSGEVVHRQADGEVPERLAVAIRAGGEVLGSIWVAGAGGRLPSTAPDALRAAARAAVPHLIHHRSRQAGQAQLVQEAARGLLAGRMSAEVLVAHTALPLESPCAVLAVHAAFGPEGEESHSRVSDLVALHCATQGYQAVIVPPGQCVLVLVGGLTKQRQGAVSQVARLGESLVRQLSGVLGGRVWVGLGEVQERLEQAAASRQTAELALRGLLFGRPSRSVARVGDVAQGVALLTVLDALRDVALPADTPVARLLAYDAEQGGGSLVETLRAYLDHFGNVPAAAQALAVHPNTLRYRVRRLCEVCGIDLNDPDARLLAQVQLRLMSRNISDRR